MGWLYCGLFKYNPLGALMLNGQRYMGINGINGGNIQGIYGHMGVRVNLGYRGETGREGGI